MVSILLLCIDCREVLRDGRQCLLCWRRSNHDVMFGNAKCSVYETTVLQLQCKLSLPSQPEEHSMDTRTMSRNVS